MQHLLHLLLVSAWFEEIKGCLIGGKKHQTTGFECPKRIKIIEHVVWGFMLPRWATPHVITWLYPDKNKANTVLIPAVKEATSLLIFLII